MLLRKFLAAILLLPALWAPVAGHATPQYTVGFLPDIDFTPYGMNNAGQIAGVLGRARALHTMLYENGVVTDLGVFGFRHSYARAINEDGAIAGSNMLASGEEHAYLYQGGNLLDLGANTAGYGINIRSEVVGSIQTATGSTSFVYSGGQVTALGNLGTGQEGSALDINDHGAIVGASAVAPDQAARHPYLYSGGVLHDLGTLAGGATNGATAINNAGQVAGYSQGADGFMHAFLYDGGVMRDLGGLDRAELEVGDLNEHGTLVGTASTNFSNRIPFVSVDNALVDLNRLIDQASGWQIESAYANNDLGQIVGFGCRGGECGLVLLDLATAVPEPAAASLLVPGLLMLAGARRRGHAGSPASA